MLNLYAHITTFPVTTKTKNLCTRASFTDCFMIYMR